MLRKESSSPGKSTPNVYSILNTSDIIRTEEVVFVYLNIFAYIYVKTIKVKAGNTTSGLR